MFIQSVKYFTPLMTDFAVSHNKAHSSALSVRLSHLEKRARRISVKIILLVEAIWLHKMTNLAGNCCSDFTYPLWL
ncbi:unnamed protein product [Caretta caretta]